MAGTLEKIRAGIGIPTSALYRLIVNFNKAVVDLEALRAAQVHVFNYKVENLAAGADLTERAFFSHPNALTVLAAKIIPEGASAGVDGSNTIVVTLRNITEAVDVASVTRTADLAANTPVSLTLTAANADIAAGDVLGVVVTNGAAADPDTFVVQFSFALQTVDAAGDMTAAKIGNDAGTAWS